MVVRRSFLALGRLFGVPGGNLRHRKLTWVVKGLLEVSMGPREVFMRHREVSWGVSEVTRGLRVAI